MTFTAVAAQGRDAQPLRHQVCEVPPVAVEVREDQLHRLVCGQCGRTTCGTLPVGVSGTLDNNVANSSVDLVITASARALKWGGEISAAWDINTTVNWTNLFTGFWDVYAETSAFGDLVRFDDTAANRSVNVTTDVKPAQLVVEGALDYDIGGDGKIGGDVALVKNGSGALTLNSANSYTGGTLLNGGTLRLGHSESLGAGALNMAGGTALTSDGVDPRTLTNRVVISGNPTFGDPVLNGAITLAGGLDWGGAARSLTNHSDVIMSGITTNGGLDRKTGVGTLTLLNLSGQSTAGNVQIEAGSVVMSGGNLDKAGGGIRIMSLVPNGLAAFRLLNGGVVTFSGTGQNLRVGSSNPNGETTATNVFELAGTVTWTTNNPGGQVQMGANSALAQVYLRPGGLLRPGSIVSQGNTTEFYFDGGTLAPMASSATFVQGLSSARVLDGGAVIDTEGKDITIGQALLAGGTGGLAKLGAGTLNLTGDSTYTGLTVVSNGTLGGTGSLQSPTLVETGGALAPGNAGIGTLTINNTLTLAGTTVMEINRTNAQNADLVAGVTTLTAGGTLVVTNVGEPLQLWDTFNLFDAATFAGGFAGLVLPDLPTSEWKWKTNNLMVNGTVSVVPTNEPPVAGPDAFAVVAEQPTRLAIAKLMTNDYDPEGGTLTFVGNFTTNKGSVVIDGDHVVYTPTNGFTGLDTFTYTITDALGSEAQGTVSMTVINAPLPGQNQLGAPVFEAGTANLRFAGIPGRDYILLRALAVEGPWGPVVTNTAPANGLIDFTDPAAPSTNAFYKTQEKP